MAKTFNSNILNYSPALVKEFSFNEISYFSERAIINKDYIGLQYLMENMSNKLSTNTPLGDAIERMDVKAVKIIVGAAKNSNNSYYSNDSYIDRWLIESLFENQLQLEIIELTETELQERRIEIFEILLNSKSKDSLTASHIQKLAALLPKQKFDDFCKAKELDLREEKFKDLDLSHYKHEDSSPLLTLEADYSLMDLVLSRTYSSTLGLDEAKKIYSNLYNLDPIAKEMMTLTSVLISQNNSFKIFFEEGATSAYHLEQNIIKIDTKFLNEEIFNIESIVIHEIGHMIYHQVYRFEAMPFNTKPIKDVLQMIKSDFKEYIDDEFAESTPRHLFLTQGGLSKALAKMDEMNIMSYEAAARKPVEKAAQLLEIDSKEFDKYLFSQEYTEWLKFNSPIDVFLLNSQEGFAFETTNKTAPVLNNVFNSLVSIHSKEHNYTCESPNSIQDLYKDERAEIIRWSTEEFLPSLVDKLNLSDKQIHFLERIADYIARGPHSINEIGEWSYHRQNEKYAELIVRAMELKASGINTEEDLIASFEDLEQWHKNNVSPVIEQIFMEHEEIASLPWDHEEICTTGAQSNLTIEE